MDDMQKAGIWHQFGASIDYLAATIAACPDELWHASLWDHAEEICLLYTSGTELL